MTLGPPVARACPTCSTAVVELSLMSGNNIGAVAWSDGKVDAPMLPDLPDIARCPSCGTVFRLSTADEAPDVDARSLPWPPGPDADLFREAIDGGLAKHDYDEAGLRLRWWWAANDKHRGSEPPAPSGPLMANLERLGALLGDSPPDIIQRAEVARARGRFDEAAALYERTAAGDDSYLAEIAARLRSLAESGSRAVVRL